MDVHVDCCSLVQAVWGIDKIDGTGVYLSGICSCFTLPVNPTSVINEEDASLHSTRTTHNSLHIPGSK